MLKTEIVLLKTEIEDLRIMFNELVKTRKVKMLKKEIVLLKTEIEDLRIMFELVKTRKVIKNNKK